jgi:cytochrome c oxidase subunit 3
MVELEPEIQFASLEHQGETLQLGMWVFIATEVLFFGALLLGYAVYRNAYWHEFAIAGRDSKILLGAINEAILLTSSLTMVWAVKCAREERQRLLFRLLLATAALGLAFLVVKGFEYREDYLAHTVPAVNFRLKPGETPPAELFWIFYFVATGIHALHMSIGIGLMAYMAWRARRGDFTAAYYAPLETVGLYWSFVDTVWVFLFAAIYPLGRALT